MNGPLEPSAGTADEAPGTIDPTPSTGPAPTVIASVKQPEQTGKFAAFIGIGILLSSLLGMVRQSIFGTYFGTSGAADAFNAAARIPNFLQNLFGEGALSAAFIPVYAGLLARGERKEADRLAGAIGGLLALVTAVLVLLGIAFAPFLAATIAIGFDPARRALTVHLIRIMFPAIGLLVCSAWCLGILNSHRKFLLSYTAPVGWNLVLIGTLMAYGAHASQVHLAEILAWAMVAGSAVQFLVQVPPVLRAAPGIRLSLDTTSRHVRTVARSFLPVLVARGVVQISAYIDSAIASLVGVGAVSIFAYAQAIYLIPGRIFGTAISAAELPAMASLDHADPALHEQLCRRLSAGLGRIAYFIIPSVAAFLTLGDVIASAVFRYGRFSHADALWVWGTLAGSTVGLLASTMGRLYASAFYALKDTRTPLRFALIRVTLTLVLGYVFARHVPRLLGIDPHWGTAGLTASAGIAGWLEFMLLRHALNSKIGPTGISASRLARLWAAAIVAAAVGWGVKMLLLGAPNLLLGIATCGAFGVVYLLVTTMLGEGEGRRIMSRVTRRVASRGR